MAGSPTRGKGGPLKEPERLCQGWKPSACHCHLLSLPRQGQTQGRRGGCPSAPQGRASRSLLRGERGPPGQSLDRQREQLPTKGPAPRVSGSKDKLSASPVALDSEWKTGDSWLRPPVWVVLRGLSRALPGGGGEQRGKASRHSGTRRATQTRTKDRLLKGVRGQPVLGIPKASCFLRGKHSLRNSIPPGPDAASAWTVVTEGAGGTSGPPNQLRPVPRLRG